MTSLLLRSLFLFSTLTLMSCAAPPAEKGCKSGAQQECTCDDGRESERVCLGSGDWGACQCSGPSEQDGGDVLDSSMIEPDMAGSGSTCMVVAPSSLDFGDVSLGSSATATLTIENCSETVPLSVESLTTCEIQDTTCVTSEVFSVTQSFPTTLPPGAVLDVEIGYTPATPGSLAGTLTVQAAPGDDQSAGIAAEVSLSAMTPAPDCRTDLAPVAEVSVSNGAQWETTVQTIPLKTLLFRAAGSTGPIAGYEWTVTQSPANSTAQFTPSNAVAEPTFFLDLQGDYVFELQVFDDAGIPSCEDASRVTVGALPDSDVSIELTWDTPGDADQTDAFGTDVDLHFLHPNGTWNRSPFDIFWNNPTADWGASGAADDPTLDLDDSDGAGPEIASLRNPESGLTYAIGAFYYADNGYGESTVRLRVFARGAQTFDEQVVLPSSQAFWYAATLSWPSAQTFVVGQVQQGFPNRP